MLTGNLNALFAAVVLFVGGHFLLSSLPLRVPIEKALGAKGFRALYSLIAGAALVWSAVAYGDAPFVPVWDPPVFLRWVAAIVMPFAFILAVCGLTTRSPTAVGGEEYASNTPEDPAPGILKITRHPFLWGTGIWAVAHLLVNGDAASMILMGGIAILSFGGMAHIDQRRAARLGGAWGPIQLTTSILPFHAVATGRTHMDWKGIGWLRPAAGILAYAVFMHAHVWLFGVSPLPV
ncbi:MAG: NnrU family protein [Rhodovibrionaceae bacterium]|nr:NnrU family protein [Rhodovibrionaceae bacterium]